MGLKSVNGWDSKYVEYCDREAGQFGLPRYLYGALGSNVGAKRCSKKDSCYVPAKELLKKQQPKKEKEKHEHLAEPTDEVV